MIIEDDLIEYILQQAWDALLKAREEGKIRSFDSAVPSQLTSWLDSIYNSQLGALRATDQQMWKNKRFAIAIAYRLSINATIGMDYFMEQMKNTAKKRAMDKLIANLEDDIEKDNKVKRSLR